MTTIVLASNVDCTPATVVSRIMLRMHAHMDGYFELGALPTKNLNGPSNFGCMRNAPEFPQHIWGNFTQLPVPTLPLTHN